MPSLKTNSLKDSLERMSEEKLINLIGDDLFHTMKAWGTINGKPHYNKNNLIEMALTVAGNNLLKRKDSRRLMLNTLAPDKITSLGRNLKLRTSRLEEIIESVSSLNWADNERCRAIVKAFGLDSEEVFIKQEDEQSSYAFSPVGDKFYELLDYQFLIKHELLATISKKDVPRCLIHMPTGAGKTKTCLHGILEHYIFQCKNKGLVIWLAHSQELLNQALSSFEKCWAHLGNQPVNVYKFWGNHELAEEDNLNGFAFASFGKLMSIKNKKPRIFERIRKACVILVVDEAHKVTATETKKAVSALLAKHETDQEKCLVGLSATPGRELSDDESNQELVAFFEKRIIPINTESLHAISKNRFEFENSPKESDVIKLLQERRILAKIKREELIYRAEKESEFTRKELSIYKTDFDGHKTKDFSKDFLEKVGRIQKRNLEILQRLIKLESEKVPTIVFACSVLHAKLLTSALKLSGVQAGCVLGDSDPKDREKTIARYKSGEMNLLINCEVLTTGFDATNTRCVFITRPTLSVVLYSQMLGRGLRGPRMGGGEFCKLIDVKDNLERFTDEALAFKSFNNYWS